VRGRVCGDETTAGKKRTIICEYANTLEPYLPCKCDSHYKTPVLAPELPESLSMKLMKEEDMQEALVSAFACKTKMRAKCWNAKKTILHYS
jgi:hypothetical protein